MSKHKCLYAMGVLVNIMPVIFGIESTTVTQSNDSTTVTQSDDTTTVYPTNHTTTTVAPPTRHLDALKCLLLAALLVLCFVFSIIPFTLKKLATQSTPEPRRLMYALVFTLLSCYGGGVFLGTCLLDLLPDGISYIQKAALELPSLRHDTFPLSEFLVALGFFIVLFTEQLVMWLKEEGYFGSSSQDSDVVDMMESVEEAHVYTIGRRRSSANMNAHTNQLPTLTERDRAYTGYSHSHEHEHNDHEHASHSGSAPHLAQDSVSEQTIHDHNQSPTQTHAHGHQGHDHDLHFDPGSHSTVRAMLLVCALSLHAVFEGLALGLAPNVDDALTLFGALSIHKSLIAFSVGLRLVQSQLSTLAVWGSCLTFCVMAPLGGFMGVALMESVRGVTAELLSGCLTSVACGTFLYVTCFEILPHELNDGSHKLAKLCTMVLGFVTICLLVILTD